MQFYFLYSFWIVPTDSTHYSTFVLNYLLVYFSATINEIFEYFCYVVKHYMKTLNLNFILIKIEAFLYL